ncbi:MAG: tetratricopeptide repeat protein [Hyphomicrobium sp.]|uniref:tetratricopeptide repeat protein n=1 Tax=Hyphomicrobium sp. TaxID=82 RepID=UPI0039E31668
MTQLYATVSFGTTAALLAIILVLLRLEVHGRLPVLALARRWTAMSNRISAPILMLLFATSIGCLAFAASETHPTSADMALGNSADASSASGAGFDPDTSQALDSLRAYADSIDDRQPGSATQTSAPNSAALPDVDTMIAKLLARLEKQPNDVKGWKMLGWSYLNTDRAEEAVQAYETALKLDPADAEIGKALAAAKSAQTATASAAPTAGDAMTPASGLDSATAEQRQNMIRGMVDQLAARLEKNPNDEEGWARLMRSRVTLGEMDAAKSALSKALATFEADAQAKTRLSEAARELGIQKN